MSDHVSSEEMEGFCARTLESSEWRAVAGHLAACAACLQLFRETFRSSRNHAPAIINLSPEQWLKDEHLEYEDLVDLADGKLDQIEREMVSVHLKACGRCQEDVASFLDYRRQVEPELKVRYLPAEQRTFAERFLPRWSWPTVNWKPAYTLPLLAAACGAILLLAFFWKERGSERQAQGVPSPSLMIGSPTPLTQVSVTPPVEQGAKDTHDVINKPSSHDQVNTGDIQKASRRTHTASTNKAINIASRTRKQLALLNDEGREVRINKTGAITGLDDLPPEAQQLVKETLLAGEIAIPPIVSELAGGRGGLRGSAGQDSPFILLAPARSVITEAQPTFKWDALDRATSYRVMVADAGGLEVANSGLLPAGARAWTTSLPLRRGEIYSWVVVAMVDGKAVTAPSPAAPEMKFKVLEERKAQELDQLKRPGGSRLALGIFCAQAGMLAEAEREFKRLVSDNPNSPLALKLLRSVQPQR